MFSVYMRAKTYSYGYQRGLAKQCASRFSRFNMFDMKLGRVGSLVVVVSPLVSLMIDQVRSLRSREVKAACDFKEFE